MPQPRSEPSTRLAFTDRWLLRETLVFERRYHRNLAMSLSEKRAIFREPGALVVWMYKPGRRRQLIGETYGVPVESVLAEEDGEGKEDLRPFAKERALYVYSTTVLPKYEGKGLGGILKAYLLGRASEAGYGWVVGHAREGASVALNQRFSAKLGRCHPNWSNTGELYQFYWIELRRHRAARPAQTGERAGRAGASRPRRTQASPVAGGR